MTRQEIIDYQLSMSADKEDLIKKFNEVLTEEECACLTGLSIERMIDLSKEGLFPNPVKAGIGLNMETWISIGWLREDVDKWLKENKVVSFQPKAHL